jgi:hypothetical protein
MVFAIALTPFSVFHHHDEEVLPCAETKKDCGHSFHIHKHADKCLICAAHFEKHYTRSDVHDQIDLTHKPVSAIFTTLSGAYAELISLALRGPPSALS